MCEEKERDSENLVSEDLKEYGQSIVKDDDATIYLISIIGEIEGHECLPSNSKTTKYEHVLPLLAGIEESDEIDGLLLLLNTVGGDIEAGLAIAEMIAGMKKPTALVELADDLYQGYPMMMGGKLFDGDWDRKYLHGGK